MTLQKNDFIEIEFIGKIKDTNEIFDTNIKKELEKINPNAKSEKAKPFVFPLGQEMFLKAIDEELMKKQEKFPEKYIIELISEKAFGKRDLKLIQKMPIKLFSEQKINPVPGAVFNFDGKLGKVIAVSGGRVIIDFNNPVAGKDVIYEITINRKIKDINEKIKALIDFFFRKELNFSVLEKDKKIILEIEQSMKQYAELLKPKFKEILGYDLEIKEAVKEKPDERKEAEKTE